MFDTQFNWDYTGVLVKKVFREYILSPWVKLSNYDKPDKPNRSFHLPIK